MKTDRQKVINKIKEVYSGDSRLHDIDYFEEDVADWVLKEIEKAKTEAKIEVLEEVLKKSQEAQSVLEKAKVYPRRYDRYIHSNVVRVEEIGEMLSNLKKQKK